MKKFIKKVLAIFGISTSSEPSVKELDIHSILNTMPTISGDEIEYQMPSKESFEDAPQFHEDEWCQLEFFPKSQLDEIKIKLAQYKVFELKNREGAFWKEIYVRNTPRASFNLDIKKLNSLEGAKERPSPILTTSSQPLGQVKNGFSISLGEGALLYGIEQEGKVVTLAASVYSDEGSQIIANSFLALEKMDKVILVDWRGQTVIMGASGDELEVWSP